jgi:hypothetical protein
MPRRRSKEFLRFLKKIDKLLSRRAAPSRRLSLESFVRDAEDRERGEGAPKSSDLREFLL